MEKSEVKQAMRSLGGRTARLPGIVRRIGLGLAVIAALPFVISLYYSVMPPPASALMVWRLFEGRGFDYRWQPLERISPALVAAVVAAEDSQFCFHSGVDWMAMNAAIEDAISEEDEPARGASTITMQTAKNLFLWEGRSVVRKALEVPLALWIDAIWTKRRQLEVYLNIAEWGSGIYGAEAAAQKHFHRPASKLTRQQAALLASVLPNPIKRNAGNPSGAVKRKAGVVFRRMEAIDPYLACLG